MNKHAHCKLLIQEYDKIIMFIMSDEQRAHFRLLMWKNYKIIVLIMSDEQNMLNLNFLDRKTIKNNCVYNVR